MYDLPNTAKITNETNYPELNGLDSKSLMMEMTKLGFDVAQLGRIHDEILAQANLGDVDATYQIMAKHGFAVLWAGGVWAGGVRITKLGEIYYRLIAIDSEPTMEVVEGSNRLIH